MGFQNEVNITPAPAVAGDFASANPRATVLAGPGSLVAGVGGVNVGKFAWIGDDGLTVQSYGTGARAPDGFVHREQQAMIVDYLAESGVNVPVGMPITLHNEGDFWALVTGSTAATIDAAVYATYADGAITIGSAATGASATGIIGATMTASNGATFTATGAADVLTVSSITGVITVGDTISGTGVPANTTILEQLTGSAGVAGTYRTSVATTASAATVTAFGTNLHVTAITGKLSVGDTVSAPVGAVVTAQVSGTDGSTGDYTLSLPATSYTASGTITAFGVVLNITAVSSGTLAVGDPVSGTGVPSGAVISELLTGSGGVGTYVIDIAATAYAASTTITVTAGVLTNFKAKSTAAVGELVKISTWG